MDENKRLEEVNETFFVSPNESEKKAYLLLLEATHCRDLDEWLGIFTDVLELKKAYDEMKNSPKEERDSWYKFLKPAVYEFQLNTPVKDFVFDERIHSITEVELNALAEEEKAKRGEKNDHGRTGTDVG